jgi:hypothetical protein
VWLAGGAGLTAAWRERGRGRWGVLGFGRGDERVGERGGLGRIQPSRGGIFLFLFSISISFSLFL